jgi:arsenate reductase
MAEGLFRHHLPKGSEVFSAGIEAHGVNPNAIIAMAEIGINISNHTSDKIEDLPNQNYDYVITVCDNAAENCPVLLGNHKTIHHSFPDPAKATGTEAEIKQEFASVRDQIEEFVKDFVKGM